MRAVTDGRSDVRQAKGKKGKGALKRSDHNEAAAGQRLGEMQAAAQALLTSTGIEVPKTGIFFEVCFPDPQALPYAIVRYLGRTSGVCPL